MIYSHALVEVIIANGTRFIEPCLTTGEPIPRKKLEKKVVKKSAGASAKDKAGSATAERSKTTFGVNGDVNFILVRTTREVFELR